MEKIYNRFYNKKYLKWIFPNHKLGIGDRLILNSIIKKEVTNHSSYIVTKMRLFGFKSDPRFYIARNLELFGSKPKI